MSEASQDRWQTAQSYEKGYWASQSERISRGQAEKLDWYGWRAERLRELLAETDAPSLDSEDICLAEIGSGPVGLLAFLPGAERVAVDPLASFFTSDDTLTEFRDARVRYLEGAGESLPLPDDAFDIVLMENCIDHVRDVDLVLSECRRILVPGGHLYLTVNARSPWGWVMHRVLSALRIDAGHPHTFTSRRLIRTLRSHSISPVLVRADSYWSALKDDLLSGSLRSFVKALLGVSEFVVTVVARPM